MIDLHTHTSYSDGTWSVKKLLDEAEKSNIEVLSITDHDSIKAYSEIENLNVNELYSGKIIPGIEFSTVYDGIAFHLLAYGFDYHKLENFVYENYEMRKPDLNKEFELMLESCRKNNIKIDEIIYDEDKGWPVDHIFSAIKKYEENKKWFSEEEWNDDAVFFNACITNKNFPAAVDFSIHYPNAKVVAENVRKAGGKLFVAHVYRYNLKEPICFLDMLKSEKIIDGIEVEHSIFTEEQSNKLKKYCKENGLLMSGGTDCHGEKKADRKIGIGYGNMNISKELLKEWSI